MWHYVGMDDTSSINLASQQQVPHIHDFWRWKASLALDFGTQGTRSYLAKKQHVGPLVIQKMLYPEGDAVCHGIIIHPPGGVAGVAAPLGVRLAAQAWGGTWTRPRGLGGPPGGPGPAR